MMKDNLNYMDFDGNEVTYTLEKGLILSKKINFIIEVAGMVVSDEMGYISILKKPMFEHCLVKYFTDIELFKDEPFSINMLEGFLNDNKENVIEVIYEYVGDEEIAELSKACDEAIEYRKLHYCESKPDRLDALLEAITKAVNSFADRGDIDMDAVNKLVNIIPIMQDMGSKEVAKAIIRDFHDIGSGIVDEK